MMTISSATSDDKVGIMATLNFMMIMLCLQPHLGWGLLKLHSLIFPQAKFRSCKSTSYIQWITFIFYRCRHSSAVATPVKYKRDIQYLTFVLTMLKILENNRMKEIGLVTPTLDATGNICEHSTCHNSLCVPFEFYVHILYNKMSRLDANGHCLHIMIENISYTIVAFQHTRHYCGFSESESSNLLRQKHIKMLFDSITEFLILGFHVFGIRTRDTSQMWTFYIV